MSFLHGLVPSKMPNNGYTKNKARVYKLNFTTLDSMIKMEPSRIFDILSFQVEKNPLKNCLNDKRDGIWESLSVKKYFESVNQVSAALVAMGVKSQDKIALITTNNRSEWSILDMAILQTGAITVPLYPNISCKDYKYILNHSESLFCFVSDQQIYDKVSSVKTEVECIKEIYSFDEIEGCKNWS